MLVRLVVLLAVAAFISASGDAEADDDPVVIGAMYNLTGGQHDLDIPSSEGARLAVDQANAGKGVLGRQVDMVLVDGETKPEVIGKKARALFRDWPAIAGLIGFSDTDMLLPAATVSAEHDRVFLTSGATSPLLPEQVPVYVFLACFGDNVQAAAAAEWAYEALKARTVAVLYRRGSTYAELLHTYFEVRFKGLGGDVVAVAPYAPDPAELRTTVERLPAADLIYLAAQPDDVGLVVPALRQAGIAAPILGGDGLDIGGAWANLADTGKVYFTTHAYLGADNENPTIRAFLAAFAKAHPDKQPDAFTALGYDAARLLMAAIENAGSTDPQAVREALAATKDFDGVTGTISFVAGSRIPSKTVTIMEADGGRQSFVTDVLPREVPAPR